MTHNKGIHHSKISSAICLEILRYTRTSVCGVRYLIRRYNQEYMLGIDVRPLSRVGPNQVERRDGGSSLFAI